MNKKLSRRDFLRAGTLTTAGLVVAACGGQTPAEPAAPAEPAEKEKEPEAEPPAKEGVTVNYWFGWGGSYAGQTWDALKETDEFKEAIGNNTLETKGSAGDQVLPPAVAAGTPPDGASNVQYLDFMARDVLVPISDWVATSAIVKKENYLEGTWNDGFYQGTMYGVPANEGFLRYGLNYNARMVEEAGLNPDDPPQTWSECFAWHEAITQFDDAGNLKQVGFDPFDAMGGQLAIQDGFYPAVSWNWTWFDSDAGKFDLDNEMMAEAFEIMGEFYRLIGPDNMAGMRQVEGQGSWGGSFNTEVQAMLIEGYWHPGETTIDKPEVAEHNRATWAPVPDDRKGVKVQGTGGHYVIFFKDAQYTEEMFKVAEFLNSNTACDIIFANGGWLPGLKPFLSTVDSSTYSGLDFYFKSVDEADEWSSPARCPITNFSRTQFTELREEVYRDQITAAEAAAEFQKRCDTEFEQAGFG
ncbi:substrate-binding domain-containing protein [Chloroflexota bacterium]